MVKRALALGISAVVLIASLALVLLPKKNFSDNENRILAGLPQFSLERLTEGDYTEELTAYLSDHFPLRDGFVWLKNAVELKLYNNHYINGIFVCDDGSLIEDYKKPQNTEKLVGIINSFNSKLSNINTDLMLVPTAVSIYGDRLPAFASPYSQDEVIDEYYSQANTNNIDIRAALLAARDEELYYRYDHHWTSEGAYVAYMCYCAEKGIAPIDLSEFECVSVEDFYGTLYSKLNYRSAKSDTINIYKRRGASYSVRYDGAAGDSLFDMSYADKKDKYSIFLSNLHSLVEITNNNAQTQKELAVIKDSYANCLVPFLAEHYKKIYVFDPRSYQGSISEFVSRHSGITDVLFVYNVGTIDTDTGIRAVY